MKPEPSEPQLIRLNRFISESGLCSRRDADQLIFDGVVTVNGQIIKEPAHRLDRDHDAVKVNKKRIFLQPLTYILLNKPSGVVSTVDDPEKRITVVRLLKGVKVRVVPVGRLDYNTSGAMLLTNDGELALKLTHPRYGFEKTYQAKLSGIPSQSALLKLAMGVRIPTGGGRFEKTMPAKVRLLKKMAKHSLIEINLKEGRQHQVKKMCQAIGCPVDKLTRSKFGFLTVSGLDIGSWRYLTPAEINKIRHFESKPINPKQSATNYNRKKRTKQKSLKKKA